MFYLLTLTAGLALGLLAGRLLWRRRLLPARMTRERLQGLLAIHTAAPSEATRDAVLRARAAFILALPPRKEPDHASD